MERAEKQRGTDTVPPWSALPVLSTPALASRDMLIANTIAIVDAQQRAVDGRSRGVAWRSDAVSRLLDEG